MERTPCSVLLSTIARSSRSARERMWEYDVEHRRKGLCDEFGDAAHAVHHDLQQGRLLPAGQVARRPQAARTAHAEHDPLRALGDRASLGISTALARTAARAHALRLHVLLQQ